VLKRSRYFISKPKGPTADSCCKILHTCTTKNQKLLFTYVNAVVNTPWLGCNKNYNLISVKTRSKKEQRSRSTLLWDQRRRDRTNNNLWIHAFPMKQHSRSTLEVKEEQIATRLRRNEAAGWHLNATWTSNVLVRCLFYFILRSNVLMFRIPDINECVKNYFETEKSWTLGASVRWVMIGAKHRERSRAWREESTLAN